MNNIIFLINIEQNKNFKGGGNTLKGGYYYGIKSWEHYAKKYNLAASIGSDFHNESVSWNRLGKLPLLPENLIPVWKLWNKNN